MSLLITLPLAIFAGVMTWSFLEYWVHRGLGHERTKNVFGREHTAHHSRGDYFAPWWKKGGAAVLVVAAVAPPAVLLAGWVLGMAYTGGLVGFYLCYELLHRLEHVWRGVGPYARWARRHHFMHHFHDPRINHGVTSPLWDFVFGTYKRPGLILVPEKLKMRWLCDPQTGDVWEDLQGSYALRRIKKKKRVAKAA